MSNARSRYKLTNSKIRKAAACVKSGHPKSIIHKSIGVSQRSVFNWLSEAESILDAEREPETSDEKLVVRFYTAINEAVIEGADEDLGSIKTAAETDWRAAYQRLKIRDRAYNTDTKASNAEDATPNAHTTLKDAMQIENIEPDASDDTEDDLDNEMNQMPGDETDSH